jgi:hypothetical protein
MLHLPQEQIIIRTLCGDIGDDNERGKGLQTRPRFFWYLVLGQQKKDTSHHSSINNTLHAEVCGKITQNGVVLIHVIRHAAADTDALAWLQAVR